MLKPRILALATSFLISVSGACTPDGTEPGDGEAGSAAKGGSGARAGSGGKGGSAGNAADAGAVDAGDAAGSGGTGARGGSGSGGRGGAGAGGAAAGGGNAALSAELFEQDTLVRFDITVPEASITALSNDATAATYTHAGIKYGDTTLADVAIRIKGESSKRKFTDKAAFKLKFDEYVSNQTLLGLKRLTLNNMVSDPTFMAECLAYEVYRAAKLPAPRCNHALVYVNGDFYGVYANVESVDKTFLANWFGSNDGNLYEDGMSDFVDGAETSFELKTNETANNRSDLTALISAINTASGASYLTDLGGALDTAHFLTFSAVEAAVDQWDGYSFTYFEPNNYHIYHDPSSGKLTFIPWGHDLAMKGFSYVSSEAPEREYIPLFTVPIYENKTGARDAGGRIFVGDREGDPGRAQGGCLGSTGCRTQFAAAVREVIELYEAAKLGDRAKQTYALIKEHVYADTLAQREIKTEDFEAAYQALLQHIAGRPRAMRDDLTAAGF